MTPPTTDTSREAVDKALGMCGLHGLHGTAQILRALLAERDALRDQLAAARNEALEEAARVVDIEYEMHKDYRNASLLCNNDEDAQCRLISMTTCASISAAIDALKSTTPAPRNDGECPVCGEYEYGACNCEDEGLNSIADSRKDGPFVSVDVSDLNTPREVSVQEAAVLLLDIWLKEGLESMQKHLRDLALEETK